MDIGDIIPGIIVIATFCGIAILLAVIGFVVIVLVIYTSAYTIALFHILLIEPVIFDTHSLFTIPYNEIWAMANMHQIYLYVLAALYMLGLAEGVNKIISK